MCHALVDRFHFAPIPSAIARSTIAKSVAKIERRGDDLRRRRQRATGSMQGPCDRPGLSSKPSPRTALTSPMAGTIRTLGHV
jgi:hypothetical protein